jgi:hypothetical protein
MHPSALALRIKGRNAMIIQPRSLGDSMPNRLGRALCAATVPLCLFAMVPGANAQEAPKLGWGSGKLLLTGGVSSIDGAAGGGLTPWAVTASYATDYQAGGTAQLTRVKTQDYSMNAYGAAIGIKDRFEFSIARQDFDTGDTGTALGLPGLHLKQDILGAKLRVFGDAVLDSDTLMPQIAIGIEHKKTHAAGLEPTLTALGASTSGTDLYVSATKLFLAQGILVNSTLRATKANQNGLLGFGGTNHGGYSIQPEISVAWLLRKDIAIGAEYRAKPDNLNPSALADGLKEDDWADLFVAWAPSKHFSLTLAYVDLGHIVPAVIARRQTGTYLSAQFAF